MSVGTLSCTRSGALLANASYPAVTVTGVVGSNAATTSNSVTVAGGGEPNLAGCGNKDDAT